MAPYTTHVSDDQKILKKSPRPTSLFFKFHTYTKPPKLHIPTKKKTKHLQITP